MKFFKTRVFVGIVFFLLGLGLGKIRWGLGQGPLMSWSAHVGQSQEPVVTDPFDEVRRMQDQMMNQLNSGSGGGIQTFSLGTSDFKDTGSAYVMDMELNGMKAKNFNVQIEHGELMVDGSLESQERGATVSSSFHRSFPVPEDVDADRIQVDQKNEHLIVTLPKKNATN